MQGKRIGKNTYFSTAGNSAGSYSSIQLRTKNNTSGIITTASGGIATKVVVDWNSNTVSGRTIRVYGKKTKYDGPADLYDADKQGTQLGHIVNGSSTELTITGNYEYIGLRSTDGALYANSISITYETSGSTPKVETPAITPASCNFLTSQEVSITCATEGATIVYTTDNWTSQQNYSAPFTVTETTTVKAKATKSGMSDSNEATATYTKTDVLTTMDAIFAASATAGKYHVSFNNYVISEYKGSNAYSTPSVNDLAVSNTNLVASEAANYDLYSYNEPTAYWMNYKAGNFTALKYGKGYLYANKDDITLSFTIDDLNGAQFSNNEELSHTGANLNGFNLVGNPYACLASVRYLNKQDENHTLTACPYYRMNEEGNGLILDNSGKRIAPMEAVFVQYQADNFYDEYAYVSVTSYDTEDEVELSSANPSINITVSKTERGANILNNAIINLKGSYNIDKLTLSESSTRISIVNDGKEYGSFCVTNENTLPVFFKASEDGRYTISVTINNADMHYLHLIDNLTGNDIDLLESNQYTFDAKVTDYASRFKIIFEEKNIAEIVADNENFAIFADGNLIIEHEGSNSLQVIDMMGHTICTEIFNGSYKKAVDLAAGVYVLKMTSGDEEMCQKIVVR